MTTEFESHRGQDSFRKRMLLARSETRIERCREHFGWNGCLDRSANRPASFTRILDDAGVVVERGTFGKRHCRKVEEPGGDDAPSPPGFGDIGQVELIALSLGQSSGSAILQDIETFRIGLHQPVLDPVMDHLDEMAGADGPAMDIAALRARIAAIAAGSSLDLPQTGCERGEKRIKALHHVPRTADHKAIAAFQPPNAAGGADVEIVDSALSQGRGTADVIAIEAV